VDSLEPKEEVVPAVARAEAAGFSCVPSALALCCDWADPPGVTSCVAGRDKAGRKDMLSAGKSYPIFKLSFVLWCMFLYL